MWKRKQDVAKLCNVSEDQVQEVSAAQVRQALAGRVSAKVLEAGTQEPATYWRVGDRYFLDDPLFGEVVDFADLGYNSNLGLHIQSNFQQSGTAQGELKAVHELKVGALYNPKIRHWEESVQYNFRGGMHELLLCFSNPSRQEIQAVNSGRKEFALVVDGDMIVFLFRISGGSGTQSGIPWSDCPYTWHKLPPEDKHVLPVAQEEMTKQTRAALQIILVNADTGIIVAKRDIVTLSHEFTVALHQAILDQIQRPFDGVSYDRQVQALQARYPSEKLVQLAIARCEGGA